VLVFYVDEVGNERLDKPSLAAHPWFVLGAMAIKETARLSLKAQLCAVKDRFLPGWQHEDWANSEIKGRYLAQAERRIERGKPPLTPPGYRRLHRHRGTGLGRQLDAAATERRLHGLVDAIFNALHGFRPVFYFVAVDKGRLIERYGSAAWSPIATAYAYLQMRAALLVEFVFGSDEGGVFIADEQATHESAFRKGEVRKLRDFLLTRVDHPPNMEVILDKPIWLQRGQLAADRETGQLLDVALYTVAAAAQDNQWASNPWLDRLLPYIARHWTTGEIWDAGITILPRPRIWPRVR
jgi:hypothetical protein